MPLRSRLVAETAGHFELAAPRGRGAGERSLLVPEQLGLDQLRRNGRAVDLHERPRGKRAGGMDVRCQQFLPRSRFADQQHARVRARGHGGLFHHAQPRRAGPDHLGPAAHQVAQALVLLAQGGVLHGVLHGQQHAIAAQRLFQEIERPGARRFHRVGDGAVPGNHDGRRIRAVLLHGTQQVDPVAVRQFHVEQVRVGPLRVRMAPEFRHRLADVHAVAFAFQNHPQRAADVLFIIHDQDAFGSHWSQPAAARGSLRRPVLLSPPRCPRRIAVRSCAQSRAPVPCPSS